MDIYIAQGIRPDRMLTALGYNYYYAVSRQSSQSSRITKCAATGHVALKLSAFAIVAFPNNSHSHLGPVEQVR